MATSWKQLASQPETLEKRAILAALDIDPPLEGVSNVCRLPSGVELRLGESGHLIVYSDGEAFFEVPKVMLKRRQMSKGTPSGDLARWWMGCHGLI